MTYSLKKGGGAIAAAVTGRKRREKKGDKNTHNHHTHEHHGHHHHRHTQEGNGDREVTGKKSKRGKKKLGLLRYDELPEYMKDNEFIVKYYRSEWPLKQAFYSLFQWHNETLNCWTHILGFALFLGLTIMNVVPMPDVYHLFSMVRQLSDGTETNISRTSKQVFMLQETMSAALLELNHTLTTPHTTSTTSQTNFSSFTIGSGPAPRWPFYVFLAGSMFCLAASSVCHLFSCHSYHVNTLLLRIDYVGITTMIITSFFPPISYIFQCEPFWQLIYLSTITLFGLFTIVTLLSPALSSGDRRGFRAMLFSSMGFFGLIPAVHACVVNWGHPRRNLTLVYELGMAMSYLIGTGFYVSRIPERFRPGKFDLAGHSHQIFHVFVVAGALAHYGAGLVFLQWRDVVGCDARL